MTGTILKSSPRLVLWDSLFAGLDRYFTELFQQLLKSEGLRDRAFSLFIFSFFYLSLLTYRHLQGSINKS